MSWLALIICAFLLNLFVTGVFAFLSFAYPISKLFANTFYTNVKATRIELLYKRLGVKNFKILLMFFYWGRTKHRNEFFSGGKGGIAALDFRSKQAEIGHFLPFVVLLLMAVFLFVHGDISLSIFIFVFNLVGNFFPILLQRQLRVRLQFLRKNIV